MFNVRIIEEVLSERQLNWCFVRLLRCLLLERLCLFSQFKISTWGKQRGICLFVFVIGSHYYQLSFADFELRVSDVSIVKTSRLQAIRF